MIRKRLRRIAKVLGVVVALLLVLVAALPALLSTSAARRTVLARVNPHVGGELTIQRWSFGWRSGVRIEQLTFVDGEGRFGATLDRFNMSGGLLKLLGKTKNLGNVDVSGLHGWCDLDRLEAAEAAGVPAPAGRPTPADKHSATSKKPDAPAKPVDVPTVGKLRAPLPLDVIAKLTLKDIRVEARKTGQSATTLLLDGTLDCASLKQPVRFAFAADCRAADARPAASRGPGLKLEGSAQLLKDGVLDPAALVASIAFGADGFDLGGLAAARAFAPTSPAIGGLCDSALQIQVNGLRDMRAAGNLQLRNLDVKGGVLGADHLQLEEVRLDLDVARKGWNLDVQQLSLRSAPATFKAVGTLATAAGATYPTGQITMLGDVNLADVAARLPHTLKLPEAVQVQGGVFHLEGKAEGRGDALRLRAKASLRDLRGRQGELAFQQATPIDLSASAVLTAAGPVIESFDLQAGFASASGGGSATGAIFQVNADLGAAAREIDRVVGLGALGVSGQLRAKLQADLKAADAPRVDVDLSLRGLSVIGLSQWEGLASVPDFSGEWGMRASLALGQDGRMELKGTLLGNALELRGGALGSDQPRIASLRVDLDAARAGERIDIRSFDVESPLVSASVSGRVESVTGMVYPRMAVDAHVKADLVSLAQAFPATLHLQPGLQIQGGTGTLHSAVQADGAVLGWDARLVLSPLAATRGGQELRLAEAVTVETRGNLNASGPKVEMLRITSGFAQIEAAGDLAKADVKVQANLDKAMTEVGQFVDLGKLRLGGQLGATVALSSPSPSERKFGFDAHVDNLMLGGVAPETLRREQVRAAGDAVLLMAETGKLTGLRAVTLRVDGLPIGLHGRVAQVALADAATGQGLQVTDAELGVEGTMEALLAFCREAGLVKGDIPLTGPLTLETRLTSNADGVELQAFKFVSAPLGMTATGQFAAFTPDRRLQLRGSLASDCAQLALLSEAFSGFKPDLAGQATRDFMVDVPLGAGDGMAIARLAVAQMGLHADRFSQFGVTATAIDLNVAVTNARVQVVMDTDVNDGHLHAAPYLDVRGSAPVLMLPENSDLLKGVKITDEMAAKLLARIHPIFMGSAVAGGTLDLHMERLRAPLGATMEKETEFQGSMRLADLRLGPGKGLLGQILSVSGVATQEVTLPEQRITFICRDGRITPSPLIITVDGRPITLSGSVGLDQTLQYQAETPVTEKMVSKEIYPYLKGVRITLPIGGTVSAPRFDRAAFTRELAELTVTAGRNAALEALKKRAGDEVMQEGTKALGELLKRLPR